MTEQQQTSSPNQQITHDDEIDLIALAKQLWEGRKTVIRAVVICAIAGLFIAILSPKEYTASTTMVPQLSSGSSSTGKLSSLAAIAGFNLNLNQNSSELSPLVYPQILQSVPFQLEIMNSQFNIEGIDKPVSLYNYYTEYSKPSFLGRIMKYTIGLPGVILKALRGQPKNESTDYIKNPKTIKLTEEQEQVRKGIEKKINLDTNEKEGYIQLSCSFHEAKLAAQVALKAQQLLQEYITNFKIEKAKAQLNFVEGRLKEKKEDFENAQATLAAFRDRNKNVTNALARTEEERLQNEYQLAFEVYSELASQFEQAQIKVKEDTPVFSIIKPVNVPLRKSKPSRMRILFIWIFLGGVIGVGIVFGKHYWGVLKEKWEETGSPDNKS